MTFGKKLTVRSTAIPGLMVVDLPVHRDARGWFKENWQREKLGAVLPGLHDFGPVQNNISFNTDIGTTRGIHAEPWDKFVSVATGRVFGAWVDLREGDTFGEVFTCQLDPSTAVFVPRGVGNAYQTLEPDTAYTYLVNDHWSPDAAYTFLNLADKTVAIDWPISLDEGKTSANDRSHPLLADVTPMPPKKMLVTGADGQLGRALRAEFGEHPCVEYATRAELDLTSRDLATARRWRDYGTIINAAAYTRVDAAETPCGRRTAWAVNATAVASLARIAIDHRLTLLHFSSDYVFDGSKTDDYTEDDPLSPLGVYGQTKAAGEAIVSVVPRHYIVRTSWVIGEGANFVQKMVELGARGVDPRVVADQTGRLTFGRDVASAVRALLTDRPAYGVYHVTSVDGPSTWFDVAQETFRLAQLDPSRVRAITSAEFAQLRADETAPRPRNSTLRVGPYGAGTWRRRLREHLEG
ncbi:dTDP-4-dehydrorhamnose reductase [Microbacterium sp. HMWF026]|nr:dTDP-4-dehydrorhamnose reductase [Microbacterium sp. HMWF026]